jgi:X-Pro dipeptidyl-peptidase
VAENTTQTVGGQPVPYMPTTWRVAKGLLDSSNRASLFTGFGTPVTIGQEDEFKWPTLPNDFTFVAGHQIGIVLGANFSGYGSVNGTTQTAITVDTKLSKVTLPVVGGFEAARDSGAFDGRPVAKIITPPEGAVYRLDKPVTASYRCTDAQVEIASASARSRTAQRSTPRRSGRTRSRSPRPTSTAARRR